MLNLNHGCNHDKKSFLKSMYNFPTYKPSKLSSLPSTITIPIVYPTMDPSSPPSNFVVITGWFVSFCLGFFTHRYLVKN